MQVIKEQAKKENSMRKQLDKSRVLDIIPQNCSRCIKKTMLGRGVKSREALF